MLTRKTPDLENRLLLLLAIDQLGPLTGLQLLQFLAEYERMDYITMQLTLGGLQSAGQIENISSSLGPQYALTAQGREALALFLHRLPHSTRAMVRGAVPVWRPRFQRETQILSDFHRREDGAYELRLRLMEKDAPLLDMTLLLPSRDIADRFSCRWPAAAPSFYGFLMQELGDDFSPATGEQSQQPKGTYIEDVSLQGCTLRLERAEAAAPALTLALSLPTESMAWFFAGRWEAKAGAICKFLMDKLTAGA